jgi:hypothetical protein
MNEEKKLSKYTKTTQFYFTHTRSSAFIWQNFLIFPDRNQINISEMGNNERSNRDGE